MDQIGHLKLSFHFTESKDNMATTYEKIASTTLGTAASAITFSSIGSGYTDLRISFLIIGGAGTAGQFDIKYNNDSSSLYSITRLYGDGSSAGSSRFSGTSLLPCNSSFSSTPPVFATIDLFSYAGSTFKTALIEYSNDANGSGSAERSVGLYRSTSAITRIDLGGVGGTFAAGTSATIYGILKA
jgi:hypothetical protein